MRVGLSTLFPQPLEVIHSSSTAGHLLHPSWEPVSTIVDEAICNGNMEQPDRSTENGIRRTSNVASKTFRASYLWQKDLHQHDGRTGDSHRWLITRVFATDPLLAATARAQSRGPVNERGQAVRSYVGQQKYLSCITLVRRRSAGGDPDRPGVSFHPTGPPAWAEGVPFVTGPKGTETAAPTGTRSGTGFAPGVAVDHRPSSVLAFLCSCFPEGLLEEAGGGAAGERRSPSPRGSVNRWGNRRLLAPQDPSCSPL